jgi:outer membrane protein assembly factor BamB
LSCDTLPAQPVKKWSVTLGASASYPVVAKGKVFVVTSSASNSYGGDLYALNVATGAVAWGPIPLSGTYDWWSITSGGGAVFIDGFDGTVSAYNANTGREMWTQGTAYFSGEPVYHNGVIYLQGPGPVYALSATTGAVVWTSGGLDGDGSSVSVNDTGVYVAAGCSWFRLSLQTSAVMWKGNSGCTGGGGGTTYLADGVDFETVGGLMVMQATGKSVGTFSGTPAFSGSDAYLVTGTTLFVEDVTTRTPVLTATLPSSATTSPIIAGNVLYYGASNAKVYGVNIATGQVVWTGVLPGVPGGGSQYTSPISDIGIGNNLLIVPNGNKVTAFG